MAQYNPPEGYLYDENSGLYYTQIIATDENGTENQVVTWFDAESGQYSQEVYPIDENTTFIEDEELEYIDEYRPGRNSKPAKRLSRGALIGIIAGGIIAVALIAGIVILANNKSKGTFKMSNEDTEETDIREDAEGNGNAEGNESEEGEDVNNSTNSEADEYRSYPDETETEGWIQLTDSESRIPKANYIENYQVLVTYADSYNATSIQLLSVGDMESNFLCNPPGYNNGDIVYMWSIVMSDKCGIIVTGRAHNCGESEIWECVSPKYYTAQLVYEENGNKVYEDIDLGFGDECIMCGYVHIPDDVGVDFAKLDPDGKDFFEARNQIGPYKYDGVYIPVYAVPEECDEFIPSNKPHEEKSYDSSYEESYEDSYDSAQEFVYESAGEYSEDELAVMEAAGYDQASSSGSSGTNPVAAPQAGLPAEGLYRSDDGNVIMDIMDDGVIFYNSADNTRYEGWYTYESEYSGYTDQGYIYYLHVHFNSPSGEIRMELQIDTEISGLYVISGPGDYGDGWLWLG